ncbi:MAG: VacJ family lipoprotein [Cellvibrionaceae bacterium]
MLKHQCTKFFIYAVMIAGLIGCASTTEKSVDPLAGYNKAMHGFNDTLDSYILKPVAKGYRVVTPDPIENCVNNFFGNLLEIRNILNDALQWKWKQAGNDTGRFVVNSTVGIAGIFDVAKYLSLEKSEGEDFGQTLAVWGVGQGPYIVLPFLGPSNLRDTVGLPFDWAVDPIGYIEHVPTRNSSRAFDFIVSRASILDAEEFVSGDRYTFFREAYTQRRNYLIGDGEIEDDFGGDDFESEDYDDEYEDDSF